MTRKEYAKGRGKNPCGKTVSIDEPYEIYKAENQFARWFCAVKSPMTYGSWEMGDVYARDVKTYGERVK